MSATRRRRDEAPGAGAPATICEMACSVAHVRAYLSRGIAWRSPQKHSCIVLHPYRTLAGADALREA